jgi:hypothetical protein
VPEAAAKAVSIYLLFAIGFKGGVAVAAHGLDARLGAGLVAGVALSFALPFVAFALLGGLTRLSRLDKAAVAAHYGSISIVTFVAATAVVESRGLAYEGWMVAVAAAMEAPAILTALWLAGPRPGREAGHEPEAGLWREVLLNGSVVLLVGAFGIGAATGETGMARIEGFVTVPFQGILCLFLLDMGLVAGRGLLGSRAVLAPGAVVLRRPHADRGRRLRPRRRAPRRALAWGGGAPDGARGVGLLHRRARGAPRGAARGEPVGVPDAVAGVTFPFNLTLGLPLYVAAAAALAG